MPTDGFVVVAHFVAKPGSERALEHLLMNLVGPTRAEPGCLQYDLHRDEQDRRQYIFYEIWASREAWDAHMATPHIEALKQSVDEFLAEPLRIWLMRQVEPGASQ